MSRAAKWLLALLALPLVVLAAVGLALHFWVGSPDFRERVARQVSDAAGVPVQLGGLAVHVWPLPAVAVEQVQVQSRPALTLDHVEIRPAWASLLRGRLEVATLLVRDAVVPQAAIGALAAGARRKQAAAGGPAHGNKPGDVRGTLALLPRRIVLEKVTWVDAKGHRSMVDAESRLDDDALPSAIRFEVREGRFQGAQAQVDREADHWNVNARIAGGTIRGQLQPTQGAKGEPLLEGRFDTANVEVSALTAPSRTLTGRLEAHTSLRADLRDLGGLADTLVTQTKFTVHNAVVHGVDLAQAVKTVGIHRNGETRLDTLAGTVATRGMAVQLNNLVATSGVLSANGNVAMSPDKRLSGQMTVALASGGGALGVPLVVGGTLDSPSVTLSKGALLGAAIGTAIAPGVGTGAGASLGDRLGKGLSGLFGR